MRVDRYCDQNPSDFLGQAVLIVTADLLRKHAENVRNSLKRK
jgi:hypothetical protein